LATTPSLNGPRTATQRHTSSAAKSGAGGGGNASSHVGVGVAPHHDLGSGAAERNLHWHQKTSTKKTAHTMATATLTEV
jgi:hypothetical protein